MERRSNSDKRIEERLLEAGDRGDGATMSRILDEVQGACNKEQVLSNMVELRSQSWTDVGYRLRSENRADGTRVDKLVKDGNLSFPTTELLTLDVDEDCSNRH
jgi:hypothetical protein